MAKLIELRLRAVGPNHVPNPFRLGWIGRSYSAESEEWSDSPASDDRGAAVEVIRADATTIHGHSKFLRDAIAEGELTCEDAGTAKALGLAFAAPKPAPTAKGAV